MPDKAARELSEKKLALLVGYADELESLVKPAPLKPLDGVERRAVERLVQLVVEAASDTNAVLTTAAGRRPPSTSRESFDAALACGLVSQRTRDRFVASYVGLRNRVVHDYDRIDVKVLASSAARLVTDARRYAREVLSYIAKKRNKGNGTGP